ncbi:tetratricopeptide repeat protein 31 isoform X2 [Gallus gallus]|uniref:tetratricopeptide repeat protein 31 isoform X2 n=1 Tax=Gallus gallus TaxID=9031 RepID=UPI001AE5B354|nr:tetratricopeptide repeat protein 31 isoform X2 [Gallus gallus]
MAAAASRPTRARLPAAAQRALPGAVGGSVPRRFAFVSLSFRGGPAPLGHGGRTGAGAQLPSLCGAALVLPRVRRRRRGAAAVLHPGVRPPPVRSLWAVRRSAARPPARLYGRGFGHAWAERGVGAPRHGRGSREERDGAAGRGGAHEEESGEEEAEEEEAEGPEETGEVGTGAEEQTGGRIGEQLSTSLGRAAPGTALGSSLFEGTTSLPGAVGAVHGDASGAEEEGGCLASSPPPCLQGHAEEGVGDLEGIEDELDLSCTFVFKAWQKAGVKLPAPARDKSVRADSAEPNKRLQEGASKPEPALLDTNMLEQSWILAGCGNQAAMQGRYKEAVQAFTEAIKLNPREHRLFGNRSYCYEKLQQYQEALRDAQMALELQPNWPKGFFRKGKALWGLKRYAEARDTFKNLQGAHTDVAAQLEACQMLLQSNLHDASSPRDVPVLEAGEPLTPTSADGCVNGSCSDVDMSGFVTVVNSRSHSKSHVRTTTTASPQHTLPSQHPARDCYPLWVGNITFKITKKVLQSCFSRGGVRGRLAELPHRAGSGRSNPSGCSRRSTAPSSTSSRRQRQKRRTEPCWALTWRAAGWRCSSSTHPTPHRRPDSARRTLRGGLEPSSSRWALPRELLDPQRSPECCRSSGLHGRLWSHVPAAASRAFSPQQQAWPHLPHCSYLVPLPRLCPGCAALGPTGQCGGVGTHRDSPSFRDVRLLWVS